MYTALIYIHIISAIASIGPLFVLLVLLRKIQRAEEAVLAGFVESFQGCIDVVKHAGHAVVISGVLLVKTGGWSWASSWIVLTLVILAGSLVFLAKAFKPTMKTFGTANFNRTTFVQILTRNTWIYVALLLLILALMVVKPYIW